MARLFVTFVLPLGLLITGVRVGWMTGHGFLGFVAGLLSGACLALFLARRASHQLEEIRHAVRPHGRTRARNQHLLMANSAVGNVYRDVTRFVDRTERDKRELLEQLQQQALLLDRMNEGLMRVSSDGLVTYANVAAIALFGGRSPAGRSFIGVTRDHELNAVLLACLRTGLEQRHIFEIAGEGRIVDAVVVLLNQEPRETLVMLRDVTEINQLLNLRRDFVANVSHELRTPLSTIKILAETLMDIRPDDEESLRFLNKIDSEVDSMTALVRDLLDLTKLESASGRLALRDVDIEMLVNDVCDRMRPLAKRHTVAVAAQVEEGLGNVAVDERRMHQALINLLSNAIAHTAVGGTVTVRAVVEGKHVVFEVADTGSGIDVADLPRVWERFFKTDRARTGPGTGLGLAIVKHIAQAHGGAVSAASEVGVGSTFRISIPRRSTGRVRVDPTVGETYVPG